MFPDSRRNASLRNTVGTKTDSAHSTTTRARMAARRANASPSSSTWAPGNHEHGILLVGLLRWQDKIHHSQGESLKNFAKNEKNNFRHFYNYFLLTLQCYLHVGPTQWPVHAREKVNCFMSVLTILLMSCIQWIPKVLHHPVFLEVNFFIDETFGSELLYLNGITL